MERESGKKISSSHHRQQWHQTSHRGERHGIGGETLRSRSSAVSSSLHDSPDFALQWGNKKRLRCMKIQTKHDSYDPTHRTTARVDRRVIRTDHNLDHTAPPPRLLRHSENMRVSSQGDGSNSMVENDRMHLQEGKRAGRPASANNHHHHHHNDSSNDGVFETIANEAGNKKGGGGSSSGSEVIPPAVWPPNIVIALTNKEKEDDFMAIKGSKLPQRPKKRSKFVQRNLKLVSPGAWLSDLTLDRYEVREKKTSKKRPRGLKAMRSGSIDSDSE